MKWTCHFLAAALTLLLAATVSLAAAPDRHLQNEPVHDRQFWRDIAKNHYAIPKGQQVFSLVRELSGYLGSPDPELRDDLAYSILDVWIVYRNQLSATELNSLESEWETNLRAGIGETGTDSVFRRSFSVLCLAALAERDLKSPFLGETGYRKLFDDSLIYLRQERDLRGFDPVRAGFTRLPIPPICSPPWLPTRFSKWQTKRACCRRFRSVSRRQSKFFHMENRTVSLPRSSQLWPAMILIRRAFSAGLPVSMKTIARCGMSPLPRTIY